MICAVTSAKGGVGKSTVCANLGAALAMRGKRVLLIDCDLTNRSLDLLTGLESAVIYGLPDVNPGCIPPERAILTHHTIPGLCLLPGGTGAPHVMPGYEELSQVLTAVSSLDFDIILLDTPGSDPAGVSAAARLCDKALVVSSPQMISVRSAEKTAGMLTAAGVADCGLIINQFPDAAIFFTKKHGAEKKKNSAGAALIDTIDTVALQLKAVIPFDTGLWDRQNKGLLIDDKAYKNTAFSYALRNLSARMCGYSVPLFSRNQ
ncbi:MAG: P-loop NTPase [Clostridia bacterium]|nr:P-loop NTPase [Clostridia bacterium]